MSKEFVIRPEFIERARVMDEYLTKHFEEYTVPNGKGTFSFNMDKFDKFFSITWNLWETKYK